MKTSFGTWGLGALTGLCLVLAVVATKADMHWVWQGIIWIAALLGMGAAAWSRDLSDQTRDTTARAAQPGLHEGSTFHGSGHGDGGGS